MDPNLNSRSECFCTSGTVGSGFVFECCWSRFLIMGWAKTPGLNTLKLWENSILKQIKFRGLSPSLLDVQNMGIYANLSMILLFMDSYWLNWNTDENTTFQLVMTHNHKTVHVYFTVQTPKGVQILRSLPTNLGQSLSFYQHLESWVWFAGFVTDI